MTVISKKKSGDKLIYDVKKVLWALSLSLPAYEMKEIKSIKFQMDYVEGNKLMWEAVEKGTFVLSHEWICGVSYRRGIAEMESYSSFVWSFLQKTMGIHNREDLLRKLDMYLGGSMVNKRFTSACRETLLLNHVQKSERLLKAGQQDDFLYHLADQYCRVIPVGGLLAYDISCYVLLCRFGFFVGMIALDETIHYILETVGIVQKQYTNFEEYGLVSFIGHLYSNGEVEAQKDIAKRLAYLLGEHGGPWASLDFHMEFSSG